jgi:AraC-like DNA-binding protein
VFPARSVVIEQAGFSPVVADPNHVVLYDPGRAYRRELVSPDGDIATYVVVSEGLVRDLLGRQATDAPRFGTPQVTVAPRPLLELKLLIAAIELGEIDALEAEEQTLRIIESVMADAKGTAPRSVGRGGSRATRRARDEILLDVQRLLARRYAERLSLSDMGRLVGSSPYHLARTFRAATGWSLHAYREQLRLRQALDALTSRGAPTNLDWLATELGFASHAHFDNRFRRTFGSPPSHVRTLARGGAGAATARRLIEKISTITQGIPQPDS